MVVGSPALQVSPAGAIPQLPDGTEVPPSKFAGYDSNRFSKTAHAIFGWEAMGGLHLPSDTIVELKKSSKPERRLIRIKRNEYFTFEIIVEAVMGGPSGHLPEGARFTDNQVHSLTTYIFDVAMTAEFEKMTAGNWRTEHYKRWIIWLMAELARENRHT